MTSAFLGIIGRTADIALFGLLLMQLALAFRISQTVLLHLYHRRTGLERERIALTRPLPADDELPAILVQIPTFNEGRLPRGQRGALRARLAGSREPLFAVFDADYVPPPNFLRLCLRPLLDDPRLAFVQA